MMRLRPIRDEESYDAALAEVARFFDQEPAPGTPEADHFAVLLDLIIAYEARRWPIGETDPIALLSHVMELTGRTQNDLALLVGSRPRASEIMNRKRHLTLAQIRKISREWGIPADTLIAAYELSA
jgi:HTH-type transcriptional regulator/antitoxin HigA